MFMDTDDIKKSKPTAGKKAMLVFLDLSLFISVVLMILAWFFDPFQITSGANKFRVSWGIKPVVIALLIVAARVFWRNQMRKTLPGINGPADSPIFLKSMMAMIMPFLFMLLLEWMAGLAGASTDMFSPIVVQGEEASDTYVEKGVVKDPELLWRFEPGYKWGKKQINSHGFRTWEFSAEKPSNTFRVISLGDSCTAQGSRPYADRLDEWLKLEPPTSNNWESFNMGVYGYSVVQGHRQFMRDGRQYKPDVVTIYFGWNDHWLKDKPDHLRLAVRMHPVNAAIMEAMQKKKSYAWLAGMIKKPVEYNSANDQRGVRVPPEIYASTLTSLIEEVRKAGAIPVVLTAPRRSLHESAVEGGSVRTTQEGEQLHDHYVEITRRVAESTGAELVDLAKVFEDPENDGLFMDDGIHFKEQGLRVIAKTLHDKLVEMAKAGAFNP